jgi:hypothetical protein
LTSKGCNIAAASALIWKVAAGQQGASMTQSTNNPAGSQRARQRPAGVAPPPHWQPSAAPEPRAPVIAEAADQPGGRDPVRYGDWEYKGLAIDF